MIYIISLFVCFYFIWAYDICRYKKYKWYCYRLLMVWFILVSGFQYMVGTDTLEYIKEYAAIKDDLSWDYLTGGDRRQPGWNLLAWICRQITSDFILMKVIIALFYHVSVFSFFKRESKYIFMCVFFFAIHTYLVTNFNVLRQTCAISFGLYAISYMKAGNWRKYSIYTFLAYMFHNTALVLFFLPLVRYLKYDKRLVPFIILAVVGGVYILFNMDFESFALNIFSGDLMADDSSRQAISYMNSNNLGVVGRSAQLTPRMILVLMVICFFFFKTRDYYLTSLSVIYFFVLILTTMMPILWRFRLYFDFPYFVVLSTVIVQAPIGRFRQVRYFFYMIALWLAFIFPYRDYVRKEPGQKHPYIDQYYPYHSILDPVKEERI